MMLVLIAPGWTEVTPIVVLGELGPQRFAETAHRELARDVARLKRRRDDAEHARQVDDVALARSLEVRQEELAAVDHTPEVHAENPLEVLDVVLFKRRVDRDAGVVDEDVSCAVRLDDVGCKLLHLRPVGDVDPMRRDRRPVRLELVAHALERGLIHITDREPTPLLRQGERRFASNAVRGARDHRNLPLEIAHSPSAPDRTSPSTSRKPGDLTLPPCNAHRPL